MSQKEHWEQVYGTKQADAVSWFQPHADASLELISSIDLPVDGAVIDVGGGASTFVDDLLERGCSHLTVLDLSTAALDASRKRLGERGKSVTWIADDILQAPLPSQAFDLWHDRAVFHFLTEEVDRRAYVAQASRCLRHRGYLLIATFAEDGPERCSGLDVMRYSVEALAAQFSHEFALVANRREGHATPWGAVQQFNYCLLQKSGRD